MGEYADDAIRCEEDAVLEELINPCRPKSKMRLLLKILNPFIWCINYFSHAAHLHHWAELEGFAKKHGKHHKYEPYDFSTDIRYF